MSARHESPVHTRRVLAQSQQLSISVTDFHCRACKHSTGVEECNTDPSIVFVRRGVFVRSQERETAVADTNRILFFDPERPYRVSHPVDGGDDCTILTIRRELAREIVARYAPRAEETTRAFLCGTSAATPSAWRLHYALLATIRTCDELAVEELLLGLVDHVIGESHGSRSEAAHLARRTRAHTLKRHREIAHAAAVAIQRELVKPPSLAQLGRELACSPYHLSRVFRDVFGSSLRSYLAAARARAAADAIARGARSFTDLALRLGYADHSHLTNAFRKEWGVSPSAFRTTSTGHR